MSTWGAVAVVALLAGCAAKEPTGDALACELFYELADDVSDRKVNAFSDEAIERADRVAVEAVGFEMRTASAVLVNAMRRGDDEATAAQVHMVNDLCASF